MGAFTPRGCFTALVTPFTEDGSAVDWAAYEKHVEGQIAGGVTGLVPCGTTAETPTLSSEELRELVRRTIDIAGRRVPVLVGTGTNDTKETIEASRAAAAAGADAVMIVVPYYNKPNQAGIAAHMIAVARAVDVPVVLYNIPGRTGVSLDVATTLRIIDACDNVVGVKDASGSVLACQALAVARARFSVLSGDDILTVPMMSVGATGVISVTSNVYPKAVSAMVTNMLEGRWDVAREAHLKQCPVHEAMFCEPNPVPAKAALQHQGRMNATVRLPLVPLAAESRARVLAALSAFEDAS